jgi:hypothetical protein
VPAPGCFLLSECEKLLIKECGGIQFRWLGGNKLDASGRYPYLVVGSESAQTLLNPVESGDAIRVCESDDFS